MRTAIVLSALAALAAAQDGYGYEAPEDNGYDYKEPVNPLGAGNAPGGSVAKLPEEEEHHHGGSSDPLQWLRDSVPGEPGDDYPIYDTIPDTSFTCEGKVAGYYADVDNGCQPFHVCNPMTGGEMMKMSFLCPKGTIFKQEGFSCQWWMDVDCSLSEQFYNKNEEIGVVPESAASNNVGSVVRPENNVEQPETSYGQPQQPQTPRPRPQTTRPRPQTTRPRPQPQPRPQTSRPRPQPRPVPNQYIPPTTTTTTTPSPPPGLYNLPRN